MLLIETSTGHYVDQNYPSMRAVLTLHRECATVFRSVGDAQAVAERLAVTGITVKVLLTRPGYAGQGATVSCRA